MPPATRRNSNSRPIPPTIGTFAHTTRRVNTALGLQGGVSARRSCPPCSRLRRTVLSRRTCAPFLAGAAVGGATSYHIQVSQDRGLYAGNMECHLSQDELSSAYRLTRRDAAVLASKHEWNQWPECLVEPVDLHHRESAVQFLSWHRRPIMLSSEPIDRSLIGTTPACRLAQPSTTITCRSLRTRVSP